MEKPSPQKDSMPLRGGVQEALAKECDCGFECAWSYSTIFDDAITTQEEQEDGYVYNFTDSLTLPENIRVTFDGTVYNCERYNGFGYGAHWVDDAIDWSEYPFLITPIYIQTQTNGTHSVKIEAYNPTAETTECFKAAVLSTTEVKPSYISLSVKDYDLSHPFVEIHGKFNGYEFYTGMAIESGTDTETSTLDGVVGGLGSSLESIDHLPGSMEGICRFVVVSKLWSLFGVGSKGIEYVSSTETRFRISNEALQLITDSVGKSFSVCL